VEEMGKVKIAAIAQNKLIEYKNLNILVSWVFDVGMCGKPPAPPGGHEATCLDIDACAAFFLAGVA